MPGAGAASRLILTPRTTSWMCFIAGLLHHGTGLIRPDFVLGKNLSKLATFFTNPSMQS